MSEAPLPLPSIARQLKGEEHRLSQLLIQLGGETDSPPDVWRALVERAVVCLRWAQDAIMTAADDKSQEEEAPAAALPSRNGHEEQGVGGLSSVVPVFTALQMLSWLGKTGSLRVESEGMNFEVLLEKGSVVYAQGARPAPGERLGEILVRQGVLTEEDLQSALERAKSSGEPIGTLLLREELLTSERLSEALAEQACSIFTRMHSSGEAHWHFEERESGQGPQSGRLDPVPLMLRSAHDADTLPRV